MQLFYAMCTRLKIILSSTHALNSMKRDMRTIAKTETEMFQKIKNNSPKKMRTISQHYL